jgi:hypothetical protein
VRGKLLRWQERQLAEVRQPASPSPGGPLQRPPSSNHDGRVRPALVSRGRMSVGQDDPGKPSDAVCGRRAVQRIAS